MLTLEQLIKLGNTAGVDIFDGLTLPENSPFNRTVLIDTIIEKCGLNIPMYADPYIMASAISVWSARHQYTFIHIGKILTASYSPIENKDYYEDTTIDRARDLTDNTTGSTSKTEGVETSASSTVSEDKTTTHSGTDSTTEENTTSAYNASDYQPDNKTETDFTHGEIITEDGEVTSNNSGSSEKTSTGSLTNDKTVDEDEKTTTTSHQHGNIGVTTSNQLQQAEYEQMSKYNPYSFLAELFENELTLFVY